MRNIDITEWLLDNHIDSDTEIVMDGKQVFLADVLEKHLKEQFAISDVVWRSEQFYCPNEALEDGERCKELCEGCKHNFS